MEIKLNVPTYDTAAGMKYKWETGFELEVKHVDGATTITANRLGLLSLANHLLNLAQDDVPMGAHLHLDEHNSLEEGSCGLIIGKR